MLAIDSISNGNEIGLQLDSTLKALPMWEVQCELHLPGNRLIKSFEQEALLPGIILTKNQHFVGMISRKQFFEYMSRPYSLGLFSMRPIENLYNCLQPEMCIFDEDMTIVEATQVALQRSPQLVYEPILIKLHPGNYGIVDFHQLLLANSQIHALTLTQLQRVEEQSQLAKAGFRDLKKNYTRLLQNEKMAALGQLVAGIAHEVNNPINFIAGNLVHVINYSHSLLEMINLYQKYYPQPVDEITNAIADNELEFMIDDLPHLLKSMQLGCKRITQIVLSLRNFSRLDESDRKTVDIHEGIDSALIILRSRLQNHTHNQTISIIKEYGNLPLVDCYPGLLNQVFMNILANAIDALQESIENNMKPSIKPEIRIRTENINNQQVMIRIADNGNGMPEDVKNRLFEPFFTTKPVGKGTGLGLSICHQIIVEKHQGKMYCVSTEGKGAEFIIHIPVNCTS